MQWEGAHVDPFNAPGQKWPTTCLSHIDTVTPTHTHRPTHNHVTPLAANLEIAFVDELTIANPR